MDWPTHLDETTKLNMLAGGLVIWSRGVCQQATRVQDARRKLHSLGQRKVTSDEIPNLVLLLEALRIFRNHALSIIKAMPPSSPARKVCDRALRDFDRAVPRVEAIRAVSSYFGLFLKDGERKVRGASVTHNDLEFAVSFDQDTGHLVRFDVSLKGKNGFSIPVIGCCTAADELADQLRRTLKLAIHYGAGKLPIGNDEPPAVQLGAAPDDPAP